MKIMSQTKARKDFFKIAKEVNEDSVPVIATNKDALDDVVILGKETPPLPLQRTLRYMRYRVANI